MKLTHMHKLGAGSCVFTLLCMYVVFFSLQSLCSSVGVLFCRVSSHTSHTLWCISSQQIITVPCLVSITPTPLVAFVLALFFFYYLCVLLCLNQSECVRVTLSLPWRWWVACWSPFLPVVWSPMEPGHSESLCTYSSSVQRQHSSC